MRVAAFSAKPYDRKFLDTANAAGTHEIVYLEARLTAETVGLANGFDAICAFANDDLSEPVLDKLASMGTRLIVLRAAGFNNVDLMAAQRHQIPVARVPQYSPHAVAEHSFALLLTLIRKTHRAYNRIREGNFSLEGLLGFDLHGKTIGIVGVGAIGSVVAEIAQGFGCHILGCDPVRRTDLSAHVKYVPLNELLQHSDIVTLHCPLNSSTTHLIDSFALSQMKRCAILVNTSRGGVVDTRAVIAALKRGEIGGVAIDVYEEEENLFFEDHSMEAIEDDQFVRLLAFPNVIVTGHQGYFTKEALRNIASTTIANLDAFVKTGIPLHEVALPANALLEA